MSKLPNGWAQTTIGHCQGRTSSIDPRKFPDERFDLYSVPSYTDYRPNSTLGHEIGSTKQEVREGDVLLCKIVPHIRRGWTVPAATEYRQIASGEWIVFRNHGLEPEYLRRFVLSDRFHEQFMKTIAGVGGSLTRARPAEAAKIELPVPPLSEQRRIVAKLDSLTGKSRRAREHLDHIPRLVEKYKQAILAAAFRGDAELARVGDVITDIRYGTAKKCNYDGGAVPVLRIPNVQGGRIDLRDMKSADFDAKELLKLELRIGDILVIRSNGSLDLVGRSAVVDDRAAGMLFAGYLIRLRLDPTRCLPEYLHWFLQSSVARNTITNAAKSTSGVNNVNAQELQNLALPLPSIAAQKERIVSIVSAFTRIDRLTGEANSARKLIDYLEQSVLAKAFKGELVLQDPTDEPASALLDRIKAERAAAPKVKRGRKRAA